MYIAAKIMYSKAKTILGHNTIKLFITFDCRYLKLWTACKSNLIFIVLNARDEIESK